MDGLRTLSNGDWTSVKMLDSLDGRESAFVDRFLVVVGVGQSERSRDRSSAYAAGVGWVGGGLSSRATTKNHQPHGARGPGGHYDAGRSMLASLVHACMFRIHGTLRRPIIKSKLLFFSRRRCIWPADHGDSTPATAKVKPTNSLPRCFNLRPEIMDRSHYRGCVMGE